MTIISATTHYHTMKTLNCLYKKSHWQETRACAVVGSTTPTNAEFASTCDYKMLRIKKNARQPRMKPLNSHHRVAVYTVVAAQSYSYLAMRMLRIKLRNIHCTISVCQQTSESLERLRLFPLNPARSRAETGRRRHSTSFGNLARSKTTLTTPVTYVKTGRASRSTPHPRRAIALLGWARSLVYTFKLPARARSAAGKFNSLGQAKPRRSRAVKMSSETSRTRHSRCLSRQFSQ